MSNLKTRRSSKFVNTAAEFESGQLYDGIAIVEDALLSSVDQQTEKHYEELLSGLEEMKAGLNLAFRKLEVDKILMEQEREYADLETEEADDVALDREQERKTMVA